MSLFICPVCGEDLNANDRTYICTNGHSYDIARQGYVNLLPVNRRHSDNPGDSREMVTARREFLESGKYLCFSEKLNSLAADICGNRSRLAVLDCGCGEGYYSGRLTEYLGRLNIKCDLYGFDISKDAVRCAAAKYKNMHLAVASCFNMPVKSEEFDLAVNIFSPMVEGELYRLLKKGGYFIYAVPGARHLMGLKEVLYDKPYENEEKYTDYAGFQFVDRYSVKDNIEVSGEELINLFKMTPYYYKSEKDSVEKLRSAGKIRTEIHFDFLVYRKI